MYSHTVPAYYPGDGYGRRPHYYYDPIEEEGGRRYHDDRDRYRDREPVTVTVEHWQGGIGQSVCDNLRRSVRRHYPDVRFREIRGRPNSFEVFINKRLTYSRSQQGGYPTEQEVLHEISRVRKGLPARPMDTGDSCMCTIS